jgi:hypothetical protein
VFYIIVIVATLAMWAGFMVLVAQLEKEEAAKLQDAIGYAHEMSGALDNGSTILFEWLYDNAREQDDWPRIMEVFHQLRSGEQRPLI